MSAADRSTSSKNRKSRVPKGPTDVGKGALPAESSGSKSSSDHKVAKATKSPSPQQSEGAAAFAGSGHALGGQAPPKNPREAALAAAEKRQANALSHGLGEKKAKELREQPQREALLTKIRELYAARKEEVPLGVNSSSLEKLQKLLEHLQRPPEEVKASLPARGQASSTPPPPCSSAAQGDVVDEERRRAAVIQELVGMGFSVEAALTAYHVSDGNKEAACDFLLREQEQVDTVPSAAEGAVNAPEASGALADPSMDQNEGTLAGQSAFDSTRENQPLEASQATAAEVLPTAQAGYAGSDVLPTAQPSTSVLAGQGLSTSAVATDAAPDDDCGCADVAIQDDEQLVADEGHAAAVARNNGFLCGWCP